MHVRVLFITWNITDMQCWFPFYMHTMITILNKMEIISAVQNLANAYMLKLP